MGPQAISAVRLLTRTASLGWIRVHGEDAATDPDRAQGQVWQVDLATGHRRTLLPVSGAAGPVNVVTIAAGAAAGGRVTSLGFPNLAWWQPAALRHRADLLISDWRAGALLVTLAASVVVAGLVRRIRLRRG